MNLLESQLATDKVYQTLMAKHQWECLPFKHEYSLIDGIIVKEKKIVAIYELKTRDIKFETLCKQYNDEFLISKSKLDAGVQMSKQTRTPFVLILNTTIDDNIFIKSITNDNGEIICQYRIEKTKTKKNIDGGVAIRDNAFIKMFNVFSIK